MFLSRLAAAVPHCVMTASRPLMSMRAIGGGMAAAAGLACVAAVGCADAPAQVRSTPLVSVVPLGAKDAMVVGFITDAEGNVEYFKECVRRSPVVYYADDAETVLDLTPGTFFVFGGDAVDKGRGDLVICRQLVALKRKYPDRVFLIAGNRDYNKMKLTSELDAAYVKLDKSLDGTPYWQPVEMRISPRKYLIGLLEAAHGADTVSRWTPRKLADELEHINTPVNKLKYMLTHTMGCPTTFANRRFELAVASGFNPSDVSDQQVLDSFTSSVRPGGAVYEFLAESQVAAIIGNTIFVHGSVNSGAAGFIPADTNEDGLQAEVKGTEMLDRPVAEWVTALNAWVDKGIRQWAAAPKWNAAATQRGGSALFGYGYFPSMQGRTVIVTSYFRGENPVLTDDKVLRYLNSSGIHRVVVGHKPWGETPTIIRQPQLEVVDGDTSYSDSKAPDSRGAAAAAITIVGTGTENQVIVTGTLADGRRYDCPPNDPYIGKCTSDGWWVKARVPRAGAEPVYHASKAGERWKVLSKEIPASQLAKSALVGPNSKL